MPHRISPDLKNFLLSTAFLAMVIFVLAFNARARPGRDELAKFTGNLVEWSVVGAGKALRFSLEGGSADFRLDPKYFRDALKRRVPSEFRKGARVTVTARRSELQSPSTPLLSNSEIVWVRGIDVDEIPVLEPSSVEAADTSDIVGVTFCWHPQSAPSSTLS
jgi:hypothetical protein